MSSPASTVPGRTSDPATNAQDAQLLARVAQGEQTALGELYDRWSQPLQALAAAALRDPALLEDALHDTFVTVWQKAADFDPSQGSAYDWATTWLHAFTSRDCGTADRAPLGKPGELPAPSPALRARILNSAVPLPAEARYILPFPTPPAWLGWTAASGFCLAAIFFAAKSFNVRGELQAVLESERVTHLEAGTFKNLLEAERILSRGQLERLLAAERLIGELREQASPDRLNICLLTAPTGQTTPACAVVVWSSQLQEGVLVATQLPAPSADHDYQLWLTDPQSPTPIDGGVLTLEAATGAARVALKPARPMSAAPAFCVTLERKGGSTKAEGPLVLTGAKP